MAGASGIGQRGAALTELKNYAKGLKNDEQQHAFNQLITTLDNDANKVSAEAVAKAAITAGDKIFGLVGAAGIGRAVFGAGLVTALGAGAWNEGKRAVTELGHLPQNVANTPGIADKFLAGGFDAAKGIGDAAAAVMLAASIANVVHAWNDQRITDVVMHKLVSNLTE